MIKRLLVICVMLLLSLQLRSQTYGNEWINYSQNYYKIKIAQNGIFRIDSATLVNAGIPLSSINPKNFQLFHNGIQQYIYIEGESDNVFNSSDFIEFYAQKNDGVLDSSLYVNTAFVPNPYYSLINDTAVYFLTWNAALANNRMQVETDTAFSSYIPDDYFFRDEVLEYHNLYYEGETDNVGGTDARYTKAEGWFDANVIYLGASIAYNVATPNVYSAGPNSIIETVALGASNDASIALNDHQLKVEYNGNLFVDTLFKGYAANRFMKAVSSVALGAPFTTFQFSSINAGFTSNRTAVSFIRVKYPHTMNLENKNNYLFYVPENLSQSKSFFSFTNFNASGIVHVYDLTNAKRIAVLTNGTSDSVLIPNNGTEKKCFITSDGYIQAITVLEPVGAAAQFVDYSLLAVDSAYVIVTHKSLMTAAQDYKNYRSTNMFGGFHNVVIADIDQLYDQFAYGIVKSPLSIKGFSKFLLNSYPSPPQNLFLIGKSYHMVLLRTDPTYYATDLVPSFGNPSSDNLFTAGLSGGVVVPAIPTGRLAAKTPTDVDAYLNKVQQYENSITNPPAEWKKNVLHFGGGTSAYEQVAFESFLNGFKTSIEDTLYGGDVSTFLKTSSSPISINTSDTLQDFMDNGVSLMTFFGHASGSGFDLSIDDITSYNPLPGHYPFMLANGCYSGDIHSTELTTSENYVINPNKGMIGYLASVGLGVPYTLNMFSSVFYKQIALTNYGNSVGSSIRNVIAYNEAAALSDPILMATCNEMTLHADPAIVLNAQKKSDYKITNSDVFFDLSNPSPDSIVIYVVRTNLGRTSNDSIFTQAYRTFPDGSNQTYLSFSLAPKFKDTVAIKIPWDYSKDIGLNKVRITLDYFNRVDELSETNNATSDITFMISGGDIVPVYPYEFAIIPKDTITLKASTADLFAPLRNYIFQIDTADTFNSPFLQSSPLISSIGGVITWKPSLNFDPTIVYYWRVSPDSTSVFSGYNWRESSFQFIPNKRGWEQAHFFQFKNNGYQYVNFNRPLRKFDFVNDIKSLQCNNGISSYINWMNVNYKLNGSLQYVSSWAIPGFTIAVFDPISNISVKSISIGGGLSQFGSSTYAPIGTPENACDFSDTDSMNRAKITNFIMNEIPNGYPVLAYSQDFHSIPSYEESLFLAFETLGSSQIRSVPSQRSYILFGTKGDPIGSAAEVIADSIDSFIQLDTALVSNWNKGSISSPIIGPALSWDSLSWKQHHMDGLSSYDSVFVQLIGIMPDGSEDTLANFSSAQLDIGNLASYVSASTYPNIRLVAYMKDDTLNSPPQLERWQVIYTPVPEAAINPILGYYAKDSVAEGDNIIVHLPIQNISEYTFNDSLLLTYWIEDANRINHPLPSKLKKNLFSPEEIIVDTINLNTNAFPGSNTLWVEVNPIHPIDTLDLPKTQLEQYHFNNIVRIPFHVSVDKINPLLDVTFDGVHILNSDIISSKPTILIQLKDENQFLALNDTADFKVFIKSPNLSNPQRIYFGPLMSFVPAVLPNNSCKINLTPVLFEDGKYQLIVQAKDKSDNQSGSIDYKINFEVINKSTITEVMNYPNPFSTATHFVFTLTGSEVPTYFKIQILTITGKVIREITNDELGALHIGRNITEYAWDGKDEFGDQLANGVYLYRVVSSLRGEDIEKRESGADQFFKKGFGKMFLMR